MIVSLSSCDRRILPYRPGLKFPSALLCYLIFCRNTQLAWHRDHPAVYGLSEPTLARSRNAKHLGCPPQQTVDEVKNPLLVNSTLRRSVCEGSGGHQLTTPAFRMRFSARNLRACFMQSVTQSSSHFSCFNGLPAMSLASYA